jgi:hypothetical protein
MRGSIIRILSLCILLLLSITVSFRPTSALARQQSGLLATITSRAKLRAGPGTEWFILKNLDAGTPFLIDGHEPQNAWARGITSNGDIGWVIETALSVTPDQIAPLPSVWVDTPFTLTAPGGSAPAAPATSSDSTDTSTTTTDTSSAPAEPPPAPVVSTAPSRGFSYGGQVQGFSDQTAALMQYAGMTWIKRQVRYQGGDASSIGGLIDEAHARGFRILLSVVGNAGSVGDDSYFNQYAGFVGGAAGLGADAIEIWNEQNIDREWASGFIDPGRYTQLLAVSYNAIKAANPNTLVVSGAPAPTGYFGGCSPAGCDDAPFISGMAAAGAASYADCIGLHYNEGILGPNQTSGDPRGSGDYYTRYFWGMVNTYYRAFGGRRPLCFTELGYLTPEGYGPLPGSFGWAADVTVAQQAAWIDQAVSLSRSSGKVRLLLIWNIDFSDYGADPMGGYALIRPGGSCPACDALAN